MRFWRSVALVGLLVVAPPIWATAQPSLTGVITLLQGPVTVTRASAHEPAPLQLRDGVFADEQIRTGENGFARILLGGKAIVTMQERSNLQIAEDLGTSTLTMGEGRIAVAVARELTKTGELIEILTPTALASSRGAVVVVGVAKDVTTFTVVRGLVDVTRIESLSRRPVGPRVMLRGNQQAAVPAKGLLRPLSANSAAVQRLEAEFQIGDADGAFSSVLAPLTVDPTPGKRRSPTAKGRP